MPKETAKNESKSIVSVYTLLPNLDIITYRENNLLKWEQVNEFLHYLYTDIHTFQFVCGQALDFTIIPDVHADYKYFVNEGIFKIGQPVICISLKSFMNILPQLIFDPDVANALQNHYYEQVQNLQGDSTGQPKFEREQLELFLRLLSDFRATANEDQLEVGVLKQRISNYLYG